MFSVGLTGGIGSGKTTVLSLFSTLGVPTISADAVGKSLLQPGSPALLSVEKAFGVELVKDGVLDRAALRQRVFNCPEQRKRLEDLLHPLIFNAMSAWMVRQALCPYCVLEIPLLIESRHFHFVDRILVIDCPTESQISRIVRRDQIAESLIEQILEAQATRSERLKHAHDVIENTGDLELLKSRVAALDLQYRALAVR
jgi:dephospho-CoA kinase